MIYFIVIYISVAALGFLDLTPRMRKICIFMSVLLLAALAGWRNMGGNDFYSYRDIYYGLTLNYMSSEPGYAFLNNLFSYLGFSFNGFLFAYSFTAIALLVSFIYKHTKYPAIALLFYMATYFFFYNMVLNRQMMSMSLALWAIYLWNKNKLYSVLCLAIGASFHQSLLVLLPFLCIFEFLRHTRGKKYWIAFFTALTAAVIMFSPLQLFTFLDGIPVFSFIAKRTMHYFVNTGSYSLNIVEYIKMAAACLIILPWFKKIAADKEHRIWLFFYITGVILLLWTRDIEILFRVFAYFDLSLVVLLPLCLHFFMGKFPARQRKPALTLIYIAATILAVAAVSYRVMYFDNGIFLYYKFYFL